MASSRRLRWLAPGVVVAVIAAVAGLANLSAGATVPTLPPLSPAQLLTMVGQADVPGLSGTVQVVSNLGIPDLSSLQSETGSSAGFSLLDYLSGTHDLQLATAPGKLRITQLGQLSEDDLIVNGAEVWTWQSQGTRVEHLVVPGHRAPSAPNPATAEVLTPQQLAKQFLARITPSTEVTVGTAMSVAGRPAYQLQLVPLVSSSTIAAVDIAVDSATGVVLEVSITARGASSPSLSVGFTSVSLTAPPASEFDFVPPPGSVVSTAELGSTGTRAGARPSSGTISRVGTGWTAVAVAQGLHLPGHFGHSGLLGDMATPVTGSFGFGQLIHTDLVNLIVISGDRLAVGFVTPAVLEAALGSS